MKKAPGPVTQRVYDAVFIILAAGKGRCTQRDIMTALRWPDDAADVAFYIRRMEKDGLIRRHNKGYSFKAFLTLPGPCLDGQPAPGPIPRHTLLRLDLPDPWARKESELPPIPPPPRMEPRAPWLPPGHLLSPAAIAALYQGQRYENRIGREILPNYLPPRDPGQHVRRGSAEGGEPSYYGIRGGLS